MSFRRFGGLQYAAKHNIVSSNYNTANYLSVTDYVGQPNSYINFLSDISGNLLGPTGTTGVPSLNGDAFWILENQTLSPVNSYNISGSTGIFSYLTCNNGMLNLGTSTNGGIIIDGFGTFETFGMNPTFNGSTLILDNNSNISQYSSTNTNILQYTSFPSGITGTTGSFSNLQVNGSTNYSGLTQNPMPSALTIGTTTGSSQLLLGSYYTGDVAAAGAIQSVDYYSGSDHTQPLLLNPQGGYVGIGTTNPSTALQVNGTVTASSFNSLSDYRIKEKIIQLDNKFSIDSLKPVSYFNKESKKNDIGLIAHELQEVYPELVTGEKDGINLQTINYTGLIPILIKEIQELKSRVKELELKNKI